MPFFTGTSDRDALLHHARDRARSNFAPDPLSDIFDRCEQVSIAEPGGTDSAFFRSPVDGHGLVASFRAGCTVLSAVVRISFPWERSVTKCALATCLLRCRSILRSCMCKTSSIQAAVECGV